MPTHKDPAELPLLLLSWIGGIVCLALVIWVPWTSAIILGILGVLLIALALSLTLRRRRRTLEERATRAQFPRERA